MTAIAAYPRKYVPEDLDVSDVAALEKFYRELMDRPIRSVYELRSWLGDFSELASVVDEFGSRRYIDSSCHTDDPAIKARFLQFVQEVEPKIKPLAFELQKKFLASPFASDLAIPGLDIMARQWAADVEIFRDENVPIETEITQKVTEYDEINGRMMVQFRGKEYTTQQMARFLEDTDRPTRQEAWENTTTRVLADRDAMDDIFEKLLPMRDRIAKNAGLSDYRAYQWKAKKRFDYTPEDCLRFANSVSETCMPLVRRLDQQRAEDLKLAALRPWDMSVDPHGRAPLRPFDQENIDEFTGKTRQIFEQLAPYLAIQFDQLKIHGNLDLASRKGKRPGGYLMPLEESRQPFIFMNAAGVHRDVTTLLHEGGHAFHHLAVANEDLVFLRSAPMEFCEVASMGMELLGGEHLSVFYNSDDVARAKRTHIEGIIRLLPWIATVDSFQHWIYTHPGHSRQERTEFWLGLLDRFASQLDWSGWENARAASWQRQAHIFRAPFYYIEYGIAQLGALQLWLKSRQDPRRALANYRAALSLGGKKSLPQLFATAGIVFDFSSKTIGPIMAALDDELAALPN